MSRLLISAVTALLFICYGVDAHSSIGTEAGDTVTLWCHTPVNTTVFWLRQNELDSGEEHFCNWGRITEPYRSRFKINSLYNGYVVLTIYNVTTHDNGIYLCTGNDGHGQAKQHTRISVKGANTSSSETAVIGSAAKVRCQTMTQFRVVWLYQRNNTDAETKLAYETAEVLGQYRHKYRFDGISRFDYTLTILNVQFDDAGFYTCVEDGTSRHTVRLTVEHPVINECLSNPCANGGTCVDGINKYTCNCMHGFNGTNCDNDIDDCYSNPCKNDGICVDHIGKYKCACFKGFTGRNCEQVIISTIGDETATKNDTNDKTGAVVGVTFGVIIIILVVLFGVLFWWLRKRHRQSLSKEEEHLKADNNNENEAAVIEESLNFVSGIAAFANRMYVLRCRSLCVYDPTLKPYFFLDRKEIPDLKEHVLNDMASASFGDQRTLYISDYEKRHIRQFKLSKLGEVENWKLVPFKVFKEDKPSGLSVSRLDQKNENEVMNRLLVSCFESRKLFELDVNGEVKTEIKFPSNLNVHWDMHAVRMPLQDNFVVCHGGDEVCVISDKSEILYSLNNAGLEGKPSHAQLAWPCHVAVSKDNHIYVADYYNDRVIELRINPNEKELVYAGEVKNTEKVYRPRKLFLHDDKLLYIGVATGEVFCVDITEKVQ